jgi:hypothetical protein
MVDLMFNLRWKSNYASHTDCYQASNVNIWRDHFPPALLNSIMMRSAGDRVEIRFKQGDILPEVEPEKIIQIKVGQFGRKLGPKTLLKPCPGRFYPKGILKGVANVFKENTEPFRLVGLNNGHMDVDFNHPLAGKDLTLTTTIGRVENKDVERGGTSTDWIETLTAGPGMQARWQNNQTDYFCDDAFSRNDDTPDSKFYTQPRWTQHIDDTAIEMVRNTYDRFLDDGMHVLDLMSSWQSHLPQKTKLAECVGLGLNEKELRRNPQLLDYRVHDLNAKPTLPFESDHFDVIVNTVSIEYLTDPLEIFSEIARVLKPDGYFATTFSNRWFPTKAIKIWKDIHEFERMGLVLEYFIRSGRFKDLHTYSIRGLPRPREDRYYPDLRFSDPIYAVWGRKK